MSVIHAIEIIPAPTKGSDRADHPDKGCSLAPLCLECSLPRCRYDPVNGRQWRVRPKGIPNRQRKGFLPQKDAQSNKKGGKNVRSR